MSSPVGPTEARLLLDTTLPTLRMEHVVTRRVIAAIPAEHVDHRPGEGARSSGELARHIVVAELRFLRGVVEPAFPELDLPTGADMTEVLSFYTMRFPPVLEQLEAAAGEHLLRDVDYRGFLRMPALGFVPFALHHTIHHRGQLSVYLRAVGAKVLPIYG